MLITVLKSKLAYAKITQTNLYYEGSITIDEIWMKRAAILPNEQVHVVNINTGSRLVTYAIVGEAGSSVIGLNGPAARLGYCDDPIFILTYAQIDAQSDPVIPIIYTPTYP